MIIYKATNLINGKVYIGQTVRSLDERMREHLRHSKTAFDKALKKYGISNFRIETIDCATSIDELNAKEKYWIDIYNAFGKSGYNMCEGGGNTIGYHHTEEAKRKMSVAKKQMYKGNENPFFGKKHTPKSKAKMSQTRTGRIITPEWKEHISQGSQSKRKVHNIETDEIFNSIREAADKYGVPPTHITRVCKGKRKRTGGYHWEYVS
jgi:group I intron endonuclease